MIMNFGNDIKVSSDRLSSCLFECNWIEQSRQFKMNMIICTEFLKQPQTLVIWKLYPLDLETLMRVCMR